MNTKPACTARELVPFALIAFGLPFLMGVPLGMAQRAGYATDAFANAQMFYPAAGAMAALLLTRPKGALPRRFFWFYLLCTVLMAGCCLGVLAAPAANWLVLCSAVIVAASVIAWVLLLTHKKPVREAAGLRWHGGAGALGYVALFLALRTASVFISMALAGQLGGYAAYWMTAAPWVTMLMLVPNFFLSFLPFFGEEYGWRYFLQPRLQSRFGPRGGVLLLGVLWGLWHLPLNLFYYAPDTALQSVASQLVTCVCFGVFFAWAYMRTNNIWTAVLLHYFNNNMILVYTGAGDAAVISGQTVGWGDVLVQLALFGALFLPFLASKTFRETSGKGEL